MAYLSLTERTYNDSRRQLSLLAQVIVLDVIHRVQSHAVVLALQAGGSDDACRLLKSDLAETVLAKDVARIVQAASYRLLATAVPREDMLERVLLSTLLEWVAPRSTQQDANRLRAAFAALYGQPGADTEPAASL